jgi:hypothetical protein
LGECFRDRWEHAAYRKMARRLGGPEEATYERIFTQEERESKAQP